MSPTKKLLSSVNGLLLVLAITACAKSPQATPTIAASETAAPTTASTQPATVEPSATLSFPPSDTPNPGDQPAPPAPSGAGTAVPQDTSQATVPAGSIPTLPGAVLPTQPGGATSPGRSTTDHYQFVTQSIADKSRVSPGETVTITWNVKNTGTVAWSADYTIRFFSGVPGKQSSYKFGKIVAPGKTIDVSVTFIAPSVPGSYDTWWKLANDQGQNFGDVDFVFVIGSGSAVTPTK